MHGGLRRSNHARGPGRVTETYHRDGRTVTSDPAGLAPSAVHRYLTTSGWAEGIPLALVERSLRGSLCFGVYAGGEQVGLARVVTDEATFADQCDGYVLPEHRGRGLGRWLVSCALASPRLQGLRRWMLVTRDAQGLCEELGFSRVTDASELMQIARPGLYLRSL